MENWRKMTAAVLAVILVSSMAACGKNKENPSSAEKGTKNRAALAETEKGGKTGSMGRFAEHDMNLPEEFSQEGEIFQYNILSDGTLRLLCSAGVYDSSNQGKTWKIWEKQPEKLMEAINTWIKSESAFFETRSIHGAIIGRDGSLFYCRQMEGEIKSTYHYINKEGVIQEIPIQNAEGQTPGNVSGIDFINDHELLCFDEENNILRIDCSTGEILHTFQANEDQKNGHSSVVVAGDRMVCINYAAKYSDGTDGNNSGTLLDQWTAVDTYSLKTNEKLDENQALAEFLKTSDSNDVSASMTSYFPGKDGKSLYFANSTGIYRYVMNSSVVERIFEGSMGQMNSESCYGGVCIDEDNLVLRYSQQMVWYTFDESIPSAPEKEIKVYTLDDKPEIRSVITKFQKKNPDIYVNYQVGRTGADAVTEDDAIKLLNTNIMAGEGPDVFILDGMPIDSYMEKGLLADVSDVVNKAADTDGLFDNIVRTYQKQGQILAVPLRFSVPVIQGKKDTLAQVDDLNGFVELAKRNHAAGTDSILAQMDSFFLLKTLLPVSSPAWVKEDGTLNAEALKEFLTNAEQLVELYQIPKERRRGIEVEKGIGTFELSQFMTTGECYLTGILHETDLNLFHLKDRQNLYSVTSALKQKGTKTYDYAPAPGQASHVYIPMFPAGINAKSTEMKAAEQFISFLLGSDSGFMSGWPVNKAELEQSQKKPDNVEEGKVYVASDETGSDRMELNNIWPAKEDFDQFQAMADKLDTPAVTDETINKTVLEEGAKCLKGECTVENAVDSIISKLNLYLAE